VILLRLTCLVVDLLTYQQQHPLIAIFVVALRTVDPDIVVGDDQDIDPTAQGGIDETPVGVVPIRVIGMEVKVNEKLGHEEKGEKS
jgi:hypothetical protein